MAERKPLPDSVKKKDKKRNGRSRVANGNSLFYEPVDGRTAPARRLNEIYNTIVSDLGGEDYLSEAQLQLSRRCATMALMAEHNEALFILGEKVDVKQYLDITKTLTSTLNRLGLKREPREVESMGLNDYISQAYGSDKAQDAEFTEE